ncbi:MAG: hypothetical protein PHY91_03430 [Tissierellia bacterium]|nr:hypothetical protein [Tissierellia bacterium]MDD4727020.1 hypothetical protein [Tissierellia bacterium]
MRKFACILLLVLLLVLFVSCTAAPPEIPEEALQGSTELISSNTDIEDPEIIVEDDMITFYLVPGQGLDVSEDRLREVGTDYLKILAGYVATEEMSGPSEESYGGIYDYYNVEIIIEGQRGAILHKGTMGKGENQIQWQEE